VATSRAKIVAAARWGIANEPRIHYGQIRPMPLTRALPLTTDCSGFVTLCYYLAGAPDPNGLAYNGQGWTGTLLRHLPVTDTPRPGDLVVFGAYPGRHCAIVLRGGRDPLLASHGMERGPVAIRFSEEAAIQQVPATWLSGEAAAGAARDDVGDEDEPECRGEPAGGQRGEDPAAAPDAPRAEGECERHGAEPGEEPGEARVAARVAGGDDDERDRGAEAADNGRGEHDDR
jgi:hypothetical protein